jgi:glycosyltransferase involved in cell wall biosynthesis
VRAALNAQLLSRQRSFRSGGISRVIYHLLAELARDSRGHSYHVFVPVAPRPEDPLARGSLRFHCAGQPTVRPTMRIVWEQSLFAARLAALRPDLLHSLAYASPLAWNGRSVLTIYDLSFLRFPSAFNPGNRLYLSSITRVSARRARRITTISEHSKADITRLLGIPAARVDVTYPAADPCYSPLPSREVEAFRRAKDLPEVFLFSVGTLEPRKNLAGLLDAYALLSAPRPPLFVAGAAGWRFTPIFERVRRLGLEGDVRFLGFVPEEDLPLWYNAARLFAYPSLYEGFGLPVLEAMACGTPVIASNAASIPEVAGQAATLLPPTDTRRFADEMQRILDDPALRTALRSAGVKQASRFSWKTMADQTVRTYEMAVTER